MTPSQNDIDISIPTEELTRLSQLFRNELTAALSNQKSSLPTILNPVARTKPLPGAGIAVSIGGTNGYVSLFRIGKDQAIRFVNRKIFSLPGKTTQEDLFHLICKNIFTVAESKNITIPIGIGLAYPLHPLLHAHKFIDGELIYMTKGNSIKGLIGKRVGEEFHKFLKKEYQIDTQVIVANDAICLLVGGGDAEIAGVVGTGLNFAYWDKRSAVAPLKLGELAGFVQNDVAINIESKNFDKIPGTKYRVVIDQKSDDPGYSLAEKEASGAYLYQLFNAAKDEVIGEDFPLLTTTDELNDILTQAFAHNISINDEQKKRAEKLAGQILHRSAQIVAIELCGILMKIKKTQGTVPIIMEGGIFWKAKNYPSLVNQYIHHVLPNVIPSFARLYGSSRRGIAVLARSNL